MNCLHTKKLSFGVIGLVALNGIVACGGSESGGDPQPRAWFEPDCSIIQGPPVVTWSPDGGQTIRPSQEPFPVDVGEGDRSELTSHIAALRRVGGVMFAVQSRDLFRSADAGCRWERVAETNHSDVQFTELVATDLWAFALNLDEKGEFFRIHPDGTVKVLNTPDFDAIALSETEDDPDAVYVLERDGTIWRGGRNGREWTEQAIVPFPTNVMQQLAINPHDSRHFVVSGNSIEVMVSFDGGTTWQQSSGMAGSADSGGTFAINFNEDISSPDIWVNAVRIWDAPDGEIEDSHAVIARSVNGGQSFQAVVMDGQEVTYNDRTALENRPGVRGEVLFHGDGCPFDSPQLHIYDSSIDRVTTIEYGTARTYGIGALQTHPTNSDIIYMGQDSRFGC